MYWTIWGEVQARSCVDKYLFFLWSEGEFDLKFLIEYVKSQWFTAYVRMDSQPAKVQLRAQPSEFEGLVGFQVWGFFFKHQFQNHQGICQSSLSTWKPKYRSKLLQGVLIHRFYLETDDMYLSFFPLFYPSSHTWWNYLDVKCWKATYLKWQWACLNTIFRY